MDSILQDRSESPESPKTYRRSTRIVADKNWNPDRQNLTTDFTDHAEWLGVGESLFDPRSSAQIRGRLVPILAMTRDSRDPLHARILKIQSSV
jgi:hypothetical protein